VKLRLTLLSKRRRSVLAVRAFVRPNANNRANLKLELRSAAPGELAFARSRVEYNRVDGLGGGLLRWPPFSGDPAAPAGWFTTIATF